MRLVGLGGALVEAITFIRRVVGSTPALAWASPLPTVACALRHETPIQYPCCSRERLWVVEDLKGRYRNGRNEWMNEWWVYDIDKHSKVKQHQAELVLWQVAIQRYPWHEFGNEKTSTGTGFLCFSFEFKTSIIDIGTSTFLSKRKYQFIT